MWLKLAGMFKIIRVRADRQAGSTISLFFSLETRLKKNEFDSIVDTGCCEQISYTNKSAFNLIFLCRKAFASIPDIS